jgi:predicted nucleic acid-binding protein
VKKYALDSNLYIEAFRDDDAADSLSFFYRSFAPALYLNAVVLHELIVGSTSPAKVREIQKGVAEPFRRTSRVITPSESAWTTAANAIATMARTERRELRSIPKSLVNDYLIAASCRQHGVTLITRDTRDFESITEYIAVQFRAPWPK